MDYQLIIKTLKQGGIIAYPTEAVYGLGCDPFNEKAVLRLLALKKRAVGKGLILIAANWEQVRSLISSVDAETLDKVLASWPGPNTWLLPASSIVPEWIKGKHNTVALRVTAHPIAKVICAQFGSAIVSTSANIQNMKPARTKDEVLKQFPSGIDLVVSGSVGDLREPTTIRNAISGEVVR